MVAEDFRHVDKGAAIMGTAEQLNFDEFDGLVQELKAIAQNAVNEGTAIHEVEKELLDKLLQLGHASLGAMFQSVGAGDVGETRLHPEHPKALKRYPERSTRTYRSVFGDFELSRYLYGKAPGTKALQASLEQ